MDDAICLSRPDERYNDVPCTGTYVACIDKNIKTNVFLSATPSTVSRGCSGQHYACMIGDNDCSQPTVQHVLGSSPLSATLVAQLCHDTATMTVWSGLSGEVVAQIEAADVKTFAFDESAAIYATKADVFKREWDGSPAKHIMRTPHVHSISISGVYVACLENNGNSIWITDDTNTASRHTLGKDGGITSRVQGECTQLGPVRSSGAVCTTSLRAVDFKFQWVRISTEGHFLELVVFDPTRVVLGESHTICAIPWPITLRNHTICLGGYAEHAQLTNGIIVVVHDAVHTETGKREQVMHVIKTCEYTTVIKHKSVKLSGNSRVTSIAESSAPNTLSIIRHTGQHVCIKVTF